MLALDILFTPMFYLLPHLPSGQPVGRKKCYVFLFPEPFPFQRQKMVQVIRKEFPGTSVISRFTGTQDGFGSVQKQNRQATNQLVYQNGHEPTPEELAKAMDMSVERVREIQRMAQEPASLESPVGEEEDSSLGDFVADENAEAPGKAADRAMVAQQINLALKSLTPREEKVIRLRFGLDDGRPRTLEEVGRDFGVTRERVRQIEAKAIRKLHSRKCLTLLNGLIE